MSSPSSSTRSQQKHANNARVTRHALRTANSIPSNCTTSTPDTPSKQLRVRALSLHSPKQPASPRSHPVRPKRKPSHDSDENSNSSDETLNCENYESPAKKMRSVASDCLTRESRSPTKQQQPGLVELVEPVTSLEALANAKAAFKPGSVPGRLVGRDSERSTIVAFLTSHATHGNTKSGSLYVSGVPGTGKSAMIDEIIDDFTEAQKGESRVRHMVGKINCMQFTDPQAIYKKILSEFDIEEGAFDTNVKEPFRTLERAFGHMEGGDKVGSQTPSKKGRTVASASLTSSKKIMHLLVLDEIDQLATRDQSVLYRIFEWAALPGSTLVLIGIANALDLMQRYLPRLVGMTGGPKLLNFNPYGPPEISAIIKSRLLGLQETTFKAIQKYNISKSTSPSTKKQSKPLESAPEQLVSFMQPSAVELCSRKASGTGDLRRALDLVRVSFENLEVETRRKMAKASTPTDQENAPPPPPPSKAQTNQLCSDLNTPLTSLEGIPKVGVAHVLKAANSVSGPGPVQKVKVLATQQKAVLLVLMNVLGSAKGAFVKRTAGKELLLGDLHEAYVSVLKRKQVIKPVTKTEFGDIMGLFESVGLVSLGKAKEERLKKVQLECLPAQVEDGIRDDPVLWGMWKELVASASTLI
ncbi:hypothetical protein CcCBS67573_g04354 [Chytriomyces confervae]|uniref:Cell division control protein n=1 Tax=Chytriomyces confervae TaxID=246404 RepID=A0A507FDS3_9FUNG|nr:AAA ATPase [Chytriomyces hyalinus]TPX74374.1 hypothetical protein CcCBS67573_g04354 [Chytriomyces confervae]